MAGRVFVHVYVLVWFLLFPNKQIASQKKSARDAHTQNAKRENRRRNKEKTLLDVQQKDKKIDGRRGVIDA